MRLAAVLPCALLLAACASSPHPSTQTPPPTQPHQPLQIADLAVINADVVTMDDARPRAQAVAVAGGKIIAVGTTAQIQPHIGPNTTVFDQPGAVLPGFIDAHSHTAGFAFYTHDSWVDVSSINMYFKPPPGDARCKTPKDPQRCFIPVRNQADVVERLKMRLVDIETGRSSAKAVLAFNYDPSRLGNNPPRCKKGSVAFQCQNFENGAARAQLDHLSTTIPIYVASESGHISYVNTPALKLLEICGTLNFKQPNCKMPTTNPDQEMKLAELGQLDEDLSLRATGYFANEFMLKGDKGLAGKLLYDGAMIYANHGFTLVQEGAADLALAGLWFEQLRPGVKSDKPFPVAAALVMYDVTSDDFTKTIDAGKAARLLIGENNPLLHVAALKSFADGSPQGFTANLSEKYLNLYEPFTSPRIFKQPYTGLPDVDGRGLFERLNASHAAGFPMVIHQNGDKSITEAVDAMLAASRPPAGKRDLVLHAPMITAEQLEKLGQRGDVVASFLIQNVHFWGLPECHQVLGLKSVVNMYPMRTAREKKVRTTLHSDSPVTTPYPLFEAWVAKTRRAQEMPWYAPHAKGCPHVFIDDKVPPGDQSVSIADSLRALTIDAAWQYGMENVRGSLEVGKYADLVMLSADPTTMENDPDQLKTVRVLRTVRYGAVIENPRADEPPIWPGNSE